jgi:plasmid maintenance system antidote protein VapI
MSKRKQKSEIIVTGDADLGELLKSMIDESGKSRYAIAEATGITEAALSRQYNGKAATTLKTLAKVGEAIGYRVTVQITKAE